MAIPVHDNEPAAIHAGETIKWRKSLGDFPASTWTLVYSFRGTTQLDITAVADGDDHLATISKTQSAALNPGSTDQTTFWDAYVTAGAERSHVGTGEITISGDLSIVESAHDGRSQAKRTLDAIQALIEGKATSDQRYIIVGDRQLHRLSPSEIVEWEQVFIARVAKEESDRDKANGKSRRNNIGVRFVEA